jgi:hypothetical protein
VPENTNSFLTMLSDLSKLLDRFLLSDSIHVCLSWALPQAFAFWTILILVALVGTYSYHPCTRANQEFPRSEPSFVAELGWYFTPGYFSCECESHRREGSPFANGDSRPFTFHLYHFGQAH